MNDFRISGLNKIKVIHPNHQMYNTSNNVTISGASSGVFTTLSSSLSSGASSLSLSSSTGFPGSGTIRLKITSPKDANGEDVADEVVSGTISGTTVSSLTRGVEGSDINHASGASVELYQVAGIPLTEINKTLIRMCLDAGASGLIFSTVEDATQAAQIKELCMYPKYGGKRGLGLVRQNKWGYSTLVNKRPIIIAQIETKRAVHNLKEIYAQGLDHYMIGPYDLSASLGVTAQFDNPKFLEAIEAINKVITDPSKMAVHIPTDVDKHIDKYAEYAIIAVGMDTTILLEGYKELV